MWSLKITRFILNSTSSTCMDDNLVWLHVKRGGGENKSFFVFNNKKCENIFRSEKYGNDHFHDHPNVAFIFFFEYKTDKRYQNKHDRENVVGQCDIT